MGEGRGEEEEGRGGRKAAETGGRRQGRTELEDQSTGPHLEGQTSGHPAEAAESP